MASDLPRDKWLDTAVSGIRFGPDRKAVREELAGHIEDREADLRRIFPDIPEEEAQARALSGMGDPAEVRREMARVHRPWLGWLWMASRWLAWGLLVTLSLFSLGTRGDFDSSLRGVTGTKVYHRIQNGEKAELGQYTFQITGAAYLDRPELEGAHDNLQVVLRVSSPRFWERVDPYSVYNALTATGPDGVRYFMQEYAPMQYDITDELGNETTIRETYIGAWLCQWEPWWREFTIHIPAEGWQPGDRVTLEVDSPVGRIELSVPVTERVAVP